MSFNNKNIKSILGVDVRARCSNDKKLYEPFKNPIIHKRVDGIEIIPIDTTRLWGK
ncbi:hypothetical protein [Cytobacillus praedii]|uniref:hypothetical protein n=1 Tax=Cytobacillus praedii TaxID=1742358 RepID=UPI003F7F0AC9